MTAPTGAPRRLRRSRDERVVGGVLGGLAEHTGIDPIVFRVVAVVGVLFGGAWLLAAYVAAWLLLPDGEDGASALENRDVSKLLLVAIGVVAVLALPSVLGGPFGHDWHGGGIGFVLLVGLGYWLWRRDRVGGWLPDRDVPPPGSSPSPTAPPATTVTTAIPAPRPAPPRSVLGRLTLSVAALVAGGLALLDAADVVELQADTFLAAVLLVLGAGLLVGSWFGRARWLVPVALLLTVMTAVAAVADVPLRGGAGERRWAPVQLDDVHDTYRLGAGDAELDLSGLELGGRSRRIEVSVGMGQLRLVLPPDVTVEIDAHVGFGELDVRGDAQEGIDLDRDVRVDGDDGDLELVARVGMGRLEVR